MQAEHQRHPADALLAVVVSAGVLLGSVKGGLLGVGIGLFMDVLFGKCVGLSAIAYMVAGRGRRNVLPEVLCRQCDWSRLGLRLSARS